MSLDQVNFEEITEKHLLQLIDVGVTEGFLIDYKAETYRSALGDKKELLKDASSFANSSGGHLVLGMEERQRVPTGLTGLPGVDPDKELQRLESLVRACIEPRIVGVRMKAIQLSQGGHAIVIRIPKSWNAPHAVRDGASYRYYLRNSAGVHEASVAELRALFMQTTDAVERARRFRLERLARIAGGETPVFVGGNGRLILHVVPLMSGADLNLKEASKRMPLNLLWNAGSLSYQFNLDGLLAYRYGVEFGYTQLFRSGTIESVSVLTDVLAGQVARFDTVVLADPIMHAVPSYIDSLRDLGVSPPIAVMISLQGVAGARISERGLGGQTLQQSDLLLPEVVMHEFGPTEQYCRSLRLPFDILANAAGLEKSRHFDDEGWWVHRRRR